MQNKKCSRLIALLLAVVLVIGVVPGQVFADTGSAVSSENTGSAPGDQSLVDEDDTRSGTVTGQDPASLNGGQQTGEKQTDGKQGDETDQLTPPTNTDDNKGPDGDTEVSEPTKVTEPTQVTDPTKDTDSTQDTDPTKDTDPTQVTEPTQDTEPTDPTDPPEEEEDKMKLVVFQDGNGNELWQIEVPKGSVLWTDDDQTPWTDMEEKDWTVEQEEGEEKEPEQWSAPADFTLDQQEHKEISVTRYLVSKAEGDKPARYYYTFTIGDVFYFTYGGELPTLDGSTFIAWKDESGSFVIDDDVTFLPEFEQEQVQTISVVSWNWVDEQEMLVEIDGVWGIGLPGVNQENPLTQEAMAELLTMLPQQITATTETDEEVTLDVEWDLSVIPENADSGEYVLQAKIVDPSYVLAADAPALTLTLQLGQTQTFTELPSGTPPYEDHIIPGVSPNGTTIELFDYWIDEQTNADDENPQNFLNRGINAEHALLFGRGMNGSNGSWNDWTGTSTVRSGIVSSQLGGDGYPKLNNLQTDFVDDLAGRDGNESLRYLFDPTYSHNGKASFSDVQGLLQVDGDGYYYFDSTKNYAVYYPDAGAFTLYNLPGILPGGTSPVGQFFPFNKATSDGENFSYGNPSVQYQLMNGVPSTDPTLNHYFGIHMSTRFVQQNGGHTDSTKNTAVTYEFTGDDDVWIFIDGQLVGDLGGIHDAASISINFATGVIKVNGQEQEKTLGEIWETGSDTLPNNSYHTLDFFYLERGNVDSNMKLKYNLVTIPESSVIKVDQLGNRIPGVTFGLYAADNPTNAIATGTTDGSGEFVFLKEAGGNQYPITIQELYNKYNGKVDSEGNNLILKEEGSPEGYRPVGDIGLKFAVSDNGEVLLLSNDTWTEGAYAMSKVTATTASTIKLEKSNTAGAHDDVTLVGQDAVENPLMFAVVYQKQQDDTWLPISGDPIGGWYVQPDSSWGCVLAAAKDNPYIFQLASSGAYQVEVSNLPGDITSYYYVTSDKPNAQYTIAYYYTTAGTLTGATAQNTWRIDSDTNDQGYKVSRVFSMDVYVSNIKNYLLVQKVDEEGNPVNGAEFALYKDENVSIAADGTVTIPESATPYDTLTTQNITNPLTLKGGGLFPSSGKVLPNGEYYLVETAAPTGYKKLVSKPIHVVVDDTGVYADAGVANDNVTVLRGVGSVVRSMVQFAAGDNVDTTLHNIKAALASDVQYQDGEIIYKEANWDSQDVLHLEYDNEGGRLDYGPHADNGELALETDVGWSKLLIRQCDQQHNAEPGGYWKNLNGQDITKLFSGTVTVRVVNDRTGNLKISKTVDGENPPANAEFTFTVSVMDGTTPLNGIFNTKSGTGNGTITFTDGKAEVTLEHNESLTILGLPYNADYTVTEAAAGGYSTQVQVTGTGTVNGSTVTGKIPHCTAENQAVTLAYINTYDGTAKVSLEGTKTFLGRTNSTETFTFTLTAGNDATQAAITKKKVELPANPEVSVRGTEKFTFDAITFKEADTYTFNIKEETPEADGDIAYDRHTAVATVVIKKTGDVLEVESVTYTNAGAPFADDEAEENKAAFTNAAASLTISKTVTGAMGDRDKPFDFQITVTQDGTPVTGSFPISNGKPITLDGQGKGTFQLKHGESIKIYGLPVGASYTISEPDAGKDGYTTKVATNNGNAVDAPDHSASGTVTDALQTVAFTNNRETGVNTGIWLDTTPMILAVLVVFAAGAVLLLTRGRGRRGGKYAR